MTNEVRFDNTSKPYNEWRHIQTYPALQKGQSKNVTVSFEYTATLSFSISTSIDIEYLSSKTGIKMEFTGMTSTNEKYIQTETWTGPMAARVCFRQVVVIPVKKGTITLPTTHVVCIDQSKDIKKVGKFIPIK